MWYQKMPAMKKLRNQSTQDVFRKEGILWADFLVWCPKRIFFCPFDCFLDILSFTFRYETRRLSSIRREWIRSLIDNIENSPFRTKFDKDVQEMKGNMGIGCISDYEPQPLIVRSHHGTYAITTVSKINNIDEIVQDIFDKGHAHFLEMSGGDINATELVAALINQKENLIDGIRYALETIDGSLTLMLLTPKGIYAARDKYGRTPIVIGQKENAYCVTFEDFAYRNLGYHDYKELGPGEIDVITTEGVKTLVAPGKDMRTFLWVYYGYPSSSYEGVEALRKCAIVVVHAWQNWTNVKPDIVAGVPDSGIAHAVGYSNGSCVPFSRPFIKYTPTWPRSFYANDPEPA